MGETVLSYFKMKKGQVDLMETIMVLVIVVVLLILGIFFYYTFFAQSVEQSGVESCFQSTDVLLLSVVNMPEIQCSVNTREKPCVDASKLLVFEPGRNYGGMFETNCPQRIYFEQVYPVVNNVTCTRDTYPNCNIWYVYEPIIQPEGVAVLSTPVSLYFPDKDEYTMGKLVVEAYI